MGQEGQKSSFNINLLDAAQLEELARDKSDEGRGRLAGAVSGFFDRPELTESEGKLASHILMGLIRQAEQDLRMTMSERIAAHEHMPPEIVVFLANDVIPVAKPVLRQSPVLKDSDLVYIISLKGEEYARNIAERSKISPVIADRLIDTGDAGTMRALVENTRAELQKNCIKKLIKVSLKADESLHSALLHRPEMDGDLAVDLYMTATPAARGEISERFQMPVSKIEASLDAMVEELCLEARSIRDATPEMLSLARKFTERSALTPDLMVKTLKRGQTPFFIALFAEKTGFDPDIVVQMIQKDLGKPLAVTCRALGMMKAEFSQIYLMSRGVRGGDRILDQRELAMALKYYDAITSEDAQKVVRSWSANPALI